METTEYCAEDTPPYHEGRRLGHDCGNQGVIN